MHTILLGGIGGDSHSVGLTIIRYALQANGYQVLYLGIQNTIRDFFDQAPFVNAVMISCMDGHARQYLRDFPEFKKQYSAVNTKWYLGGNLAISEDGGDERYFINMGFDRAFLKFIDIKAILEILKVDLYSIKATPVYDTLWERFTHKPSISNPDLCEVRFEKKYIEKIRLGVLEHWKTGVGAKNLFDNAEFIIKNGPFFSCKQSHVNLGHHKTLVQPRCGVGLIDHQIDLFKAFKKAGSVTLSYQVDSFTRNNNYREAEHAIKESKHFNHPVMNGFPVINYGVSALRKILNEVKTPLQVRHSTKDPRLLAEISYAGGVTSFEGGAISYNLPYYKQYKLEDAIPVWQYVDRLTGLYFDEFGIVLDREFFGVLTATLIPPCLAIVTGIIEALLAMQQGVKCVSLGYAEQGNRVQDIAAILVMDEMANNMFRNLGYYDVQVNTIFHQYMAAFPQCPNKSENIIFQSAVTGKLSNATRILTKTPVESFKIPSKEDNLKGVSLAMSGINYAAANSVDDNAIENECDLIRREVDAIFNSILFCGGGKLTTGLVKAFKKGWLDIPFSPNIENCGKVVTARDTDGAVRFVQTGDLQLDKDLITFHHEKIQERRKQEGLTEKQGYLLVEWDVMKVARGEFEQWPLIKDNH